MRTLLDKYGDNIDERALDDLLDSKKLSEAAIGEIFASEGFKLVLAANINAPQSMLREILEDPKSDEHLIQVVLQNPAVPVALLRKHALETGDEGRINAVTENLSLTQDDLTFIALNKKLPAATVLNLLKTTSSASVINALLERPTITDSGLVAVLDNPHVKLTDSGDNHAPIDIVGANFVAHMQRIGAPETLTRILQETGLNIKQHVVTAKNVTSEHVTTSIGLLGSAFAGDDASFREREFVESIVECRAFADEHAEPIFTKAATSKNALERIELCGAGISKWQRSIAKKFATYYLTTPPLFTTRFNLLFCIYHGSEPVPDKLVAAINGTLVQKVPKMKARRARPVRAYQQVDD